MSAPLVIGSPQFALVEKCGEYWSLDVPESDEFEITAIAAGTAEETAERLVKFQRRCRFKGISARIESGFHPHHALAEPYRLALNNSISRRSCFEWDVNAFVHCYTDFGKRDYDVQVVSKQDAPFKFKNNLPVLVTQESCVVFNRPGGEPYLYCFSERVLPEAYAIPHLPIWTGIPINVLGIVRGYLRTYIMTLGAFIEWIRGSSRNVGGTSRQLCLLRVNLRANRLRNDLITVTMDA